MVTRLAMFIGVGLAVLWLIGLLVGQVAAWFLWLVFVAAIALIVGSMLNLYGKI